MTTSCGCGLLPFEPRETTKLSDEGWCPDRRVTCMVPRASMTPLMTWAQLCTSLIVILAGAELFTNGIEWIGEGFGLSEGAVGSVLAAVGTALPRPSCP